MFGEIPNVFSLHHERSKRSGELTYDLEALTALTLRSNVCIGVEVAASVEVLCFSQLEVANIRDLLIDLRRYVERKLAIFDIVACITYRFVG